MYFAHRSSGHSAPLNAHMIGVHIGFCAHVIHISHHPGSHHVCCHYLCLSLQWWEVSDTTYKFPPTEKKLLTVQQQLFLPCANISLQLKNLFLPQINISTNFHSYPVKIASGGLSFEHLSLLCENSVGENTVGHRTFCSRLKVMWFEQTSISSAV